MRFLGVDLAWGEHARGRSANASGVVALDPSGDVVDAGWTVGLDQTIDWIESNGADDRTLFVDAPLVVTNLTGQRLADKQVGQRYGRWWVSANSINVNSERRAGVRLRERLEQLGWTYSDGTSGPSAHGRVLSECYPYTAIVGAHELGYGDKRPPYKRKPRKMKIADFRPIRSAACDELIRRMTGLKHVDPPIDLLSHEDTGRLVEEPSPAADRAYKHREDLLDAAICAWTASLWHRHGTRRCQVLGSTGSDGGHSQLATIIAPARPEQRRE